MSARNSVRVKDQSTRRQCVKSVTLRDSPEDDKIQVNRSGSLRSRAIQKLRTTTCSRISPRNCKSVKGVYLWFHSACMDVCTCIEFAGSVFAEFARENTFDCSYSLLLSPTVHRSSCLSARAPACKLKVQCAEGFGSPWL